MKLLLKDVALARGYDREGNPRTIIDHETGERSKIDAKTIVEYAPRGSKGSLGSGERTNQEVQSLCRRILLNLETMLKMDVDCKERIVAFIPEYAAYLLSRTLTGEDGKVPYERAKGKEPTVFGVEFGE